MLCAPTPTGPVLSRERVQQTHMGPLVAHRGPLGGHGPAHVLGVLGSHELLTI